MDPSFAEKPVPALDTQDLMARCMGKLDFAERILAKFQLQFSQDLEQLEQALTASDAGSIARVAHRMKGASANVAAVGLCERAARIEELALRGCLAQIERCVHDLRSERSRFNESVLHVHSSVGSAP